jgi:hypothetical protein
MVLEVFPHLGDISVITIFGTINCWLRDCSPHQRSSFSQPIGSFNPETTTTSAALREAEPAQARHINKANLAILYFISHSFWRTPLVVSVILVLVVLALIWQNSLHD